MNVIDSSVWLSYFANDGNSNAYAKTIESSEGIIVPTIILTEIFKHVLRLKSEQAAFEIIAHIKQNKVVPLDAQLALDAGCYGVKFKLPLADSIIYATAIKFNAILWTQDRDFEGLPNVKYFSKKLAHGSLK